MTMITHIHDTGINRSEARETRTIGHLRKAALRVGDTKMRQNIFNVCSFVPF